MIATSRVEVAERMTVEEYLREVPEEGKIELINGVMVEQIAALTSHERLQGFLFTLLHGYVEERDLGEILGSRTPTVLNKLNAPLPDILFVKKERLHLLEEKGLMGAPNLAIEILSSSTQRNDRGDKFRAYERAGVRELWLVDPYGPEGTQFFQLVDGRFVEFEADENDRLHSVAVPGFWIDVEWLWPQGRFITVRQALNQILPDSAAR